MRDHEQQFENICYAEREKCHAQVWFSNKWLNIDFQAGYEVAVKVYKVFYLDKITWR